MHAPPQLGTIEAIDWLLDKCWKIRLGNAKMARECAKEAFDLSENAGYQLGIGRSLAFLAFFTFAQNQIDRAIPLIDRALQIFDDLSNEYEKCIGYVLRGGCNLQIGDYEQGFEDMLLGLELGRKHNHLQALAVGTYMLGNYYMESGENDLAYQNFQEALQIFGEMHDKTGIATAIAGLGSVSSAMKDYEKATYYHYQSLEISQEIGNTQVEARNLHDLGVIYDKLNQPNKAIEYLTKSLHIRQEHDILQGIISCYISLAVVHGGRQATDIALSHLHEAIRIAQSINSKPKLVRAYKVISGIYKQNNQPQEALDALEKYIELKSSVAGDESNAKLKTIQALHETEIQKLRNTELKKAYEKIENQNQHIIDSIKYAKRIQEALLPPMSDFEQYADHAFIFYRPKDIVSGDFYWYTSIQGQMILACVDCTGHGVPGAFMVVMGISLLDEIVNEQNITEPVEILTRLDQKIRQALKQDQTENRNTQDGMDLSIVRFCDTSNKMSFAGARSSLFYVRAGKLEEVKGSVYPIGSSQYAGKKQYEQFELDILPTDVFYMSTDGFRDQFGSEEDKKFTKPRFRELLHSISHLPMQAQQKEIQRVFDAWKGTRTQTDDVLVMGFKK
ncbi:MAG: hypothetical protein EAY75_01400 [Bacteroidetes bacterium]|nr:MAG: hypothetical protein EAY75_01400 [Bacteroidota bacterium]